jgi:hypothetical protein
MASEETLNRSGMCESLVQPADLHVFLFDRPLHPELFRHYRDFRVAQGRYYADVWIAGLNHVVTVTSGQRSMTELLACENELLPARGLVARFRLKGERDQEKHLPEGWLHMISTQVETMDEPLYKSVHNDLLRHACKRGWFHAYEEWADGDLVPFTYIDHEERDAEFHIHAFHAFPQERTLVKTQSIFEMPTA